jgi:hypothetical protein
LEKSDTDNEFLANMNFIVAQFVHRLQLFDCQSVKLARNIPQSVTWLNDIGFGIWNG